MNQPILFPDIDHFIPLGEAKIMTARYRAEKENILALECKGQDLLSICETFNRGEFDFVLAQQGCVGLRVYFGMTPDLKVKVIVVGVDADNKDILPSSSVMLAEGDGGKGVVEYGRPCPEYCPEPPLL
jgi:hypothetical protein